MKHGNFLRVLRRLLAVVLCVSIVGGILTEAGWFSPKAGATATDNALLVQGHEADPSTMDTYKAMVNYDENTRYAGRLWTDKSVFGNGYADAGDRKDNWNKDTNTFTLTKESDGIEDTTDNTITLDEDFLEVYSALGSSTAINEYPQIPIDLVITFDMSGSMGQDTRFGIDAGVNHFIAHEKSDDDTEDWRDVPMAERIANSRIQKTLDAINETIAALMAQNPQNRVAVVAYGANATVLMPLAHWRTDTYVDGNPYYLSVGGMETLYHPSDLYAKDGQWYWRNNRDTCYTVVADAKYNENTSDSFVNEKDDLSKWTSYELTVSNNVYSKNVKAFPGSTEQGEGSLSEAAERYADITGEMGSNSSNYAPGSEALKEAVKDTKELDADEYIGYFTNTQGGIYLGYKQLADSKATTYTTKTSDGSPVTVARMPVAIILSDGGANFAFNPMDHWNLLYGLHKNDTERKNLAKEEIVEGIFDKNGAEDGEFDDEGYLSDQNANRDALDTTYRLSTGDNTGNVGDEWYNVWLPSSETLKDPEFRGIPSVYNNGADGAKDGTLSTQPRWNHEGVLYSADNTVLGTSGTTLEVLLTASFMNKVVKEHYEGGWQNNNAEKESWEGKTLKTFTMNVDTKHVPQWGRLRLYPSLNPKDYPLDEIKDNEITEKWYSDETAFGTDEDIGRRIVKSS